MTPALSLYLAANRVFAGPLRRREAARLADKGVPDARRAERSGIYAAPRPHGRLIWINAVSVGETQSVLPLIAQVTERGAQVLLTTTTETAAALAAKRLPAGARHAYAPLDTPAPVARFFDHWRPDLAVMVESDLWPRQILAAQARDIPLALINARLSAGSLRVWGKVPKTAARIFSAFDLVACQSAKTADALTRLGARETHVSGDLKAAAAPLPVNVADLAALKTAIGDRPLWLAASTHPGEEAAVARAHRRAPAGALLIIVPRHPERGGEVAGSLRADGWTVAQRSIGELPTPDTQIYVADTLGELGLAYTLAPLAFIGASLEPLGGHNPYEAIPFGTALITGPHYANFKAAYPALISAGACVEVADADDLAATLPALLAPEKRGQMQAAMRAQPTPDPGVVSDLADRLLGLLTQ